MHCTSSQHTHTRIYIYHPLSSPTYSHHIKPPLSHSYPRPCNFCSLSLVLTQNSFILLTILHQHVYSLVSVSFFHILPVYEKLKSFLLYYPNTNSMSLFFNKIGFFIIKILGAKSNSVAIGAASKGAISIIISV